MSAAASPTDIPLTPLPPVAAHPRRASSSPDLRETVHLTVPDRIANLPPHPTPSTSQASPPASAIPPFETHNEIAQASTSGVTLPINPSSPPHPKPPTPSLSDPIPTWDDFPPLPGDADAPTLSFRYWYYHVKLLFGAAGSVERRELTKLVWVILFNLAVMAASIVLLAFSNHLRSPKMPEISEWRACSRPLGVWVCIWVVRITLVCLMHVWTWRRQKLARILEARANGGAASGATTQDLEAANTTGTGVTRAMPIIVGGDTEGGNAGNTARPAPALPHSTLYSRVSLVMTLISLTWWFTLQVFLYTSVHNCRVTSPHLWWLSFGLACVGYFYVLEIIVVAMALFFVGPLVVLLINSILLCLGRPLLLPSSRIKPTVGKLPKETVDRIPLVIYIPSPYSDKAPSGPQAKEEEGHNYPPTSASPPPEGVADGLFGFFGRRSGFLLSGGLAKKQKQGTWEDQWEKGFYPFVRLSGTRATCSICLEEYEEPRRRGQPAQKPEKPEKNSPTESKEGEKVKKESRGFRLKFGAPEDPLKLKHAGNGAQPLRLLACSHIFHKTCIDPWLTDVSGRCPVCQRPVEVDGPRTSGTASPTPSATSQTVVGVVQDNRPPRGADGGQGEDVLEE